MLQSVCAMLVLPLRSMGNKAQLILRFQATYLIFLLVQFAPVTSQTFLSHAASANVSYAPLSTLPHGQSVFMANTKTVPPFFVFVNDAHAGGHRDHSALVLRDSGVWEPPQTAAVTALLSKRCRRKGATVVNAGGYVGYYAFLAAKLGCHVHVWEPQPINGALLQLGVIANGLTDKIHLHQNICTEQKGDMKFSGDGMDGHVTGSYAAAAGKLGTNRQREVANGGAHDEKTHSISPLAIDDVVSGTVELLVIDTEGFEPHVMASAKKLLHGGNVHALFFEYNLYRAMDPEQGIKMLRMLLSLGYHITVPFVAPYAELSTCKEAYMIHNLQDAVDFTVNLRDDKWPCAKYAVEMVAFRHPNLGSKSIPYWLNPKLLRSSVRGHPLTANTTKTWV